MKHRSAALAPGQSAAYRFERPAKHVERDLALPKTLKSAILALESPGIRGMSVLTRRATFAALSGSRLVLADKPIVRAQDCLAADCQI
jgi:hypothetical protein